MALVITKLYRLLIGWNSIVLLFGHFLLVALGMSFAVEPRTAIAQDILVKRFTDLTGKAKFGRNAQTELVNALTRKGATVKDSQEYLALAKKKRIPTNKAFLGPNIKKLAKVLKLNGVVIGKAVVEKRKYKLGLDVFNKRGVLVLKKLFVTKNPSITPESADNIIAQVYAKLGIVGPPHPVVEQPTITQPTEPEVPAAGATETGLPSWARKETAVEPAPPPPPPPPVSPPPVQEEPVAPAKLTEAREKGSVSDILLTAGAGLNLRYAHLSVEPDTGFIDGGQYPSLRIDGRFMLGALTNVTFVKDLGVGGVFNMSLAHKFRPIGYPSGTEWDANQYQWHAELIYRLAFNSVALKPALLVRAGYGMTISTIESSGTNVSYKYPFAALDIYLMLWNPYLRFFASPGIMFLVKTGKNVVSSSNSNLGFSVLAGFEVMLFNYLTIGAGYDLSQFLVNLDGGGSTSDTYQTFFVRVGFIY